LNSKELLTVGGLPGQGVGVFYPEFGRRFDQVELFRGKIRPRHIESPQFHSKLLEMSHLCHAHDAMVFLL
jgi:hypothetical protein